LIYQENEEQQWGLVFLYIDIGAIGNFCNFPDEFLRSFSGRSDFDGTWSSPRDP
jgi:hypothetical protein